MNSDPITAGIPEFCRLSGLSRSTVYELLKAGSLDSTVIGGRRLIVIDSYRKLVAEAPRGSMIEGMGRKVGQKREPEKIS